MPTYGVLLAVSVRQSTIGNLSHTYSMGADKLRHISNAPADFSQAEAGRWVVVAYFRSSRFAQGSSFTFVV
jgi:hypothetical protein